MDRLGDLFTRIRNAYMARKDEVIAPMSKVSLAVAKVLAKQGLIGDVRETANDTGRTELTMTLKYVDKLPALAEIRRVSKPGRRVYAGMANFPRSKRGLGTVILSTPLGILTAQQATRKKVGGEILCEVIRGASV